MARNDSREESGATARLAPLWSRPLVVDQIPDTGLAMHIEADESERAALASLDDLVGIAALSADFSLERQGRDRVRVRGTVRATVTQTCVVSLDPFEADIEEPVDVTFARQNGRAEAQAVVLLESATGETSDPPDPIIDGRIDLGALAAEFLALGLDPHPRKPGVEFAGLEVPATIADGIDSPFASLARIDSKSKR